MVGAKEDCSKIKNDKMAAAREDYPVFPGCFFYDVMEQTDKSIRMLEVFLLSKIVEHETSVKMIIDIIKCRLCRIRPASGHDAHS